MPGKIEEYYVASGRVYKEDSTVVNIGDLIEDMSASTGGGLTDEQLRALPVNVNIDNNFIDTPNGASKVFAASELFRGTWYAVAENNFNTIVSTLETTEDGVLDIDFSNAAAPVNGDDSSVSYSVTKTVSGVSQVRLGNPVESLWYRHRFQNGAISQTVLLVPVLLKNSLPLVMIGLDEVLTDRVLAGVVTNVQQQKNDDGVYAPLQRADLGGLRISVNEYEAEAPIKSLGGFLVTRTTVTTTPALLFTPNANCRSWVAKAVISNGSVIFVGESLAKGTVASGFPLGDKEWVGGDLESGSLYGASDTGTHSIAIFETIL
jgi:hypothetical protein